jgi:hypothetical protein
VETALNVDLVRCVEKMVYVDLVVTTMSVAPPKPVILADAERSLVHVQTTLIV